MNIKHCIYHITNKSNNMRYVGRTSNPKGRCERHFRELRGNKHHNIYLQRAFNKYGEENFMFKIIEDNLTLESAIEKEQFILDEYKDLYNISKAATGGDLISNHPNYEEICRKIGEASRRRILEMTPEEKEARYGHTRGKGNPNYKNRGKNSPLYGVKKPPWFSEMVSRTHKGKKLNDKHLQALKPHQFKKGYIPWNRRKVYCEGEIYESIAKAAEAYNMSIGGIQYRIKSKDEKFKEFYLYK